MKRIEQELDKIFRDIVFLIYRNTCIWSDDFNVKCSNILDVSHLISRSNKYYRWDLNNGVLMCRNHHSWWHGTFKAGLNIDQTRVKLKQTHPVLSDFILDNQSQKHMFKPDFEAIKLFLLEHANEAIKKGEAPFPSLYDKS